MKSILIVEDEPLIALDLQFACEDAGATAITAASSRQAVEALDAHAIDGAVLDVNLGRGETCETVVRELRTRGIPFVVNSGDLNRSGEFVRELGVPIIAKPSAASDVIDRLLALGDA